MLRRLEEVDPGDPGVGGKAAGLARARAAGLPVPETFVLSASAWQDAVFAAGGLDGTRGGDVQDDDAERVRASLRTAPIPAPLAAALQDAADRLGGADLVVRSSATLEDAAGGAAPGIFASRVGVGAGAALLDAVRAVWASALGPAARAYLARRGRRPGEAAMAIVLQRRLVGPAGTAYSRAPGGAGDDHVLVEGRGTGDVALVRREGLAVRGALRALGAAEVAEVARAALAAERALGVPADIEWVREGRDGPLWIVQARPIPPAPAAGAPDEMLAALAFARAEPEATWTWDAAHNPDPLSPAQEGLVALVDQAGVVPLRQRVVLGYLYTTAHGAPPPARKIAAADLRRVYDAELVPAMERALAAMDPDDLEATLAAYLHLVATYAGALTPGVGHARGAVVELLAAHVSEDAARALAARLLAATSPLERALAEVARGEASADELERWAAPLAPAWDVACPTYGEDPRPLRAALRSRTTAPHRADEAPAVPPAHAKAARALLESRDRLPPDAARRLEKLLPAARDAAALAEEDDVWFARAQAGVRRALARLAARWRVPLDDLVHLPLDEVRAAARAGTPPAGVAVRAAGERARRAAWARLTPPLHVVGGEPVVGPPPGEILRGRGTGGRARGRVVRVAPPFDLRPLPADAVVVTATVTPAMVPLLVGAAALVVEHGGLLGHGAALARELGIPAIVGCAGALARLEDGDRVWLDGDDGWLVRLGSGEGGASEPSRPRGPVGG